MVGRLAPTARLAVRRLALILGTAALGWLAAKLAGIGDVTHSAGYLYLAAGLLAVGLYSSTYGIGLDEARHSVRVVLLAATVGVLVKAMLIAALMYLVFRRPEYLVLGVVVAQIDPLSVAAMRTRPRMSERAKAILLAWASFDDPVTVLLTIYLSGLTLSLLHRGTTFGLGGAADGTLSSFATKTSENLLFAAAAYLAWRPLKHRLRPSEQPAADSGNTSRRRLATGTAALAPFFAVAIWRVDMLGLAITGLFFRPPLRHWLARTTQAAFLLALFALGMVLGPGIDLGPGLVLGSAAFGAQIVVAALITWRQSAADRVYLALGQQNGITAIILALLLEPAFPHTVAIVAPSIFVTNVLNVVANALWDRREARLMPAPPVAAAQHNMAASRRKRPRSTPPTPASTL